MSDTPATANLDNAAGPGTISKGRASGIMVASVIAAVSALVINVIAGRSLPPVQFVEFMSYWALLFAAFSIIGGIQNEATRAVSAVRLGAQPRARVLSGGLIIGALGAIVLAITSPWWGHAQVGETWPWIIPVMALAVFGGTLQSGIQGSAAGLTLWGPFATLVGGEASIRLVLVLAAAVASTGLAGLEIATAAAGPLIIVALMATRGGRAAAGARGDVRLPRLLRNQLFALASSAAYAILVVGFPAVFRALVPQGSEAERASLMAAVSLTRAPIMMPLLAFQGVAIAAFTRRESGKIRALMKPMMAIAALGVVGGLAAWAVASPLFTMIYGARGGLGQPGWVFMLLVWAAVPIAWLTLTGTATIAADAHRGYTAGWAVAALVTVLVLLVPLSPALRIVVALCAGPLCGVALHLATLAAHSRAAQPSVGAPTP